MYLFLSNSKRSELPFGFNLPITMIFSANQIVSATVNKWMLMVNPGLQLKFLLSCQHGGWLVTLLSQARLLRNCCSHTIKIWKKLLKEQIFYYKKLEYAIIYGFCHISIKTVISTDKTKLLNIIVASCLDPTKIIKYSNNVHSLLSCGNIFSMWSTNRKFSSTKTPRYLVVLHK